MEKTRYKIKPKATLGARIWKNREYYIMLLPALIYVLIFCYAPMYGLQIAFKDYKMSLGFAGSKWVGLRHFENFFNSYYFKTLLRNTLVLSLQNMLIGFPIPILLALLLNEVKGRYKKVAQTIVYAPHFISTVVLVGMMNIMFSPSTGVVNSIIKMLGFEAIYFFGKPEYFRGLYIWSGVWQASGWSAIIYLAALSGVDPGLHDAASIDGATRIQRILHVNLPCIAPTIIIQFILRMGSMISVGYEKAFLLQTNLNLDLSEIISTFVYKRGLVNMDYDFASAVGLFNNLVNITLLLLANRIASKVSETSLF